MKCRGGKPYFQSCFLQKHVTNKKAESAEDGYAVRTSFWGTLETDGNAGTLSSSCSPGMKMFFRHGSSEWIILVYLNLSCIEENGTVNSPVSCFWPPLRAPASAAGGRGYDKSLHSYRIHHLQQVARELVIKKHEGYYFLCCKCILSVYR